MGTKREKPNRPGLEQHQRTRVVSHQSLVLGCSKNAPGQGVRTEPTRSGLGRMAWGRQPHRLRGRFARIAKAMALFHERGGRGHVERAQASLPGCWVSFSRGSPVVSSRHSSTTGYGLGSLRLHGVTPDRFSWIGDACWIFFRKSFVLRSLRAWHWPAPRSLLGLRKHLLRNHFPPNGIVPAKGSHPTI